MNVLDLFSGIGGFSLGLERAGMRTVAFCEIEPFCRAVLRKHWPHVPIYDDVRTLTAERLRASGIVPDVICGGFPCQDISTAGKGAGIEGSRSGLWSEYARLIGELRPRYAIVENVAALLHRGLDRVLGDLAALGFDAEWHCIPASAIGAPHRRDRLWLVAHANGSGFGRPFIADEINRSSLHGNGAARCDAGTRSGAGNVANASIVLGDGSGHYDRSDREGAESVSQSRNGSGAAGILAHADSSYKYRGSGPLQMGWGRFAREATANGHAGRTQWGVEPNVGRVAHGVSARVDRLCGLGNAVVPQIPEIIGRAIMNTAADTDRC